MPKPLQKEKIILTYYVWRLGRRNGTYYADGRSNLFDLGRHSLGTQDRTEALNALNRLDLTMAVRQGKADASLLKPAEGEPLPLAIGRQRYLEHTGRARVAGGARPVSLKRYRAVFHKFEAFCASRGVANWNQVTVKTLTAYGSFLDGQDYAPRTQYLELTTLKQVLKWLVEEGRLPASARIMMRLEKPIGSDTYCWRSEEVEAMLAHCRADDERRWLAEVILALSMTGLRISELRDLRWRDLDLENGVVRLVDESSRRRRRSDTNRRTTKSGRDRVFPIHQDLKAALNDIPRHPDGYVVHGSRGGRLKPDVVRRVLIRNVIEPLADRFPSAEGDIGFKDGRLHSFRHFFCSLCANSGVPERTTMLWLGHADSDMVRHYYHLHDNEAQRHMSRLRLGTGGG